MSDNARPNRHHMRMLRTMPADGQWRTFTEMWRFLPKGTGWHHTRNALLRGVACGMLEHREPSAADRRRNRKHRGWFRWLKGSGEGGAP